MALDKDALSELLDALRAERRLSTKAGDLELQIPKLRHGAFFPSLLEPRRRIDRAP